MKGDFTRYTFKPGNHYSSVRSQQGRVQVDADWNEEVDILAHLDRTTRRDVIGACGGPQGQDAGGNDLAGFRIDASGAELRITRGRYYVDGLLVENEEEVPITEQPDLPYPPDNVMEDVLVPAGETLTDGSYLAFLDVWERHVTALEAPHIREVALGGPDTTTRTQVVWQVRLMRADTDDGTAPDCATELALWDELTAPSSGQLRARAEPGETETDPCVVPEQAGYRGLENQLYRVEVHRVVSGDEITIKWSRENGSVVFAWTGQDNLDPNKLTLSGTGRDAVLGLATDDWVELTDDRHELRGEPGLLVRVVNVEGDVLTIDPGLSTVDLADLTVNSKVRRWDVGSTGEITVDLTLADNWIALENGVEVALDAGTYRTGDYWLIPARTATRDVEWPADGAGDPLPQPAQGVEHHYCRLAVLDLQGEVWQLIHDCRNLFPPLTGMVRFFHVGGDGQETMPGQPVPAPLQVGVVNGQQPVAGARVQFQVSGGSGVLAEASGPCSNLTSGGTSPVVVETGPDGVAGCCWRPDTATLSQQVEATLLEIDGKPLVDGAGNPLLTPIRFNANLSVAGQVAYDPAECGNLSGVTTVKEAIDRLCQIQPGGGCSVTVGEGGQFKSLEEAINTLRGQGQRDLCICLLAGGHRVDGLDIQVPPKEQELHLKITGCGHGSRLFLNKPAVFVGLQAVTLRDMAIEACFVAEGDPAALHFDRCSEVRISGCHVSGLTALDDEEANGALLSITNADRVWIEDNVVEAARPQSLERPREVFAKANIDFLAALFRPLDPGECGAAEFRARALDAAGRLSALNQDERRAMQRTINDALDSFRGELTEDETLNYSKLVFELGVEQPALEDMHDTLLDIRRAAIKSRPGVALVLGSRLDLGELKDLPLITIDSDDVMTLENNEIAGILSLYGMPGSAQMVRDLFNIDRQELLKARLRNGELSLRESGWLGSLQLRGNQVTRVAVARHVFEALVQALDSGQGVATAFFKRCATSDNVIEGGDNWMACVHHSLTGNDFRSRVSHPQFQSMLGMVIGDSATYVANHSIHDDALLRDLTARSSLAANLDIIIQ
ncbi:MAG TPA: DUF6519 domain-containing protein [Anaerolineae bacterium]|nr:DUF6519 domain-containing protein [Anaerolineae bacterium]